MTRDAKSKDVRSHNAGVCDDKSSADSEEVIDDVQVDSFDDVAERIVAMHELALRSEKCQVRVGQCQPLV